MPWWPRKTQKPKYIINLGDDDDTFQTPPHYDDNRPPMPPLPPPKPPKPPKPPMNKKMQELIANIQRVSKFQMISIENATNRINTLPLEHKKNLLNEHIDIYLCMTYRIDEHIIINPFNPGELKNYKNVICRIFEDVQGGQLKHVIENFKKEVHPPSIKNCDNTYNSYWEHFKTDPEETKAMTKPRPLSYRPRRLSDLDNLHNFTVKGPVPDGTTLSDDQQYKLLIAMTTSHMLANFFTTDEHNTAVVPKDKKELRKFLKDIIRSENFKKEFIQYYTDMNKTGLSTVQLNKLMKKNLPDIKFILNDPKQQEYMLKHIFLKWDIILKNAFDTAEDTLQKRQNHF
jgi:hypothetical protein